MRRIRRIELRDVRGVHELIVDVPDRGMLIVGTNGSGKSSALNGAKGAITGADTGPDAISHGAERAELVAFSDNEVVRRLITARRSTVTVNKPGEPPLPRPQERLDRAAGELIDPLALRDAAPAERVEIVQRAIPATATLADLRRWAPDIPDTFDVSGHALDAAKRAHDVYYELRRAANAKAKAATDAARAARTGAPSAAPTSALSVQQARDTVGAARVARHALTMRADEAERTAGRNRGATARALDLRKKAASERAANGPPPSTDSERAALEACNSANHYLDELRKKLVQAEASSKAALLAHNAIVTRRVLHGAVEKAAQDLDARAADIEASIVTETEAPQPEDFTRAAANIAIAEASLAEAEAAEAGRALRLRAEEAEAVAKTDRAESDRLDTIVKALATEAPRALLGASAIDGLEIRDGDIWLDGVRFGGLCGMEQLVLAVDVAKRVAGDLRVLFVDGLERIAEDQLDEVIGRATEGGFAFIATRVEKGELQFVTLDHVPIPAKFTAATRADTARLTDATEGKQL